MKRWLAAAMGAVAVVACRPKQFQLRVARRRRRRLRHGSRSPARPNRNSPRSRVPRGRANCWRGGSPSSGASASDRPSSAPRLMTRSAAPRGSRRHRQSRRRGVVTDLTCSCVTGDRMCTPMLPKGGAATLDVHHPWTPRHSVAANARSGTRPSASQAAGHSLIHYGSLRGEGDDATSSPVRRTSRRMCIPASGGFTRSTTSSNGRSMIRCT